MLPLDIYYAHLEALNGIRFTPREVDIIACILNGRSAKTIPSLLSIAPKTVAAHIENIRSKAGCSSRESIIDFIEASEKCALIKNEYYLSLLTQNFFDKSLREFSKLVSPQAPVCSLIYEQGDNIKFSIVPHLKHHLSLAGLKVKTTIQKGHKLLDQLIAETNSQHRGYILYILPDVAQLHENNSKTVGEETLIQKMPQCLDQVIFLFLNDKGYSKDIKGLNKLQYVNFSEQKNYYFSFVEILKIICPQKDLDKIFNDFKQQIQLNHPILKDSHTFGSSNDKLAYKEHFLKKILLYVTPNFLIKKIAYLSLGIIFSFGILFTYDLINKEKKQAAEIKNENIKEFSSIRSDLTIPTTSTFLNRSKLIAQIESKFRGYEGIQTLALIGVGGAGKTILARQYAHQQKANVVWEINAETRGDLNTSFEKLGAALSKTDKDKRELRTIQDIKGYQEREEKLIQFIKMRLKAISNWFLIFDNIEKLTDIQNYFPQDIHTWGTGKIILTTRDYNLQNSSQINQVLFIGEMDKSQKLSLFSKIMNQRTNEPFTVTQEEETKHFLEKIPSFPLDVSVAAYYLKTTNISYSDYLENLKEYKNDFDHVQTNILKEVGNYGNTRYGIITLSLKQIIAASKDFSDLFLFISLINAQNIPRDLLEKYKDNIVVDNFIYHLKKYSLTINGSLCPSVSLTLHHSTQDIVLPYLVNQLNLKKGSSLIKAITNTLDDYMDQAIEQEDFPKMKMMVGNLEKFLDHSELLTDVSKGLLKSKLGSIYYFINDNKSRRALEDSLALLKIESLNRLSKEDNSRVARSFLHIGAVYTELRLDKEAEELFEKAISIYEKEKVKNYADLSWALTHLGNVHRRLGNYEKARDYLEESLRLHTQHGLDKKRMARALAYLGFVYRKLGFHQKAIKSLEESLELYRKNVPNDYFRVGWVLTQLGNAHSGLGEDGKAKQYLENSLLIFEKHLPENHLSMGLALAYLGNYCRKLGEYEKSRDYLEKSLKIYQKYSNESHLRIGWILFNLAGTYQAIGNDEKAQKLFDKVLEIYANHCKEENILTARLLRDMAKIYLQRNHLDMAEDLITRSLNILQAHNHVDAYKSFEALGEIYLKKSIHFFQTKNNLESEGLQNQAIDKFQQALNIIEQNFPKHSVHIERILSKIKSKNINSS